MATSPAHAERIAAAISNSTLVIIPKAGHSSTLGEQTAVNAAIEGFLQCVHSPV